MMTADGNVARRTLLGGLGAAACLTALAPRSLAQAATEGTSAAVPPSETNLGPAVSGVGFANGAMIGRTLWLGASRMSPARVVGYDFDQAKVVASITLPGVAGVWGLEALGTDLYVGTYTPGRLLRIDTLTQQIVDTVDVGEEVVWNVKASPDGQVFLGTYPNAELWQYDPVSRTSSNLGSMSEETYIRDLDANETTVYCGIGASPQLIAYDRASATKTNIMPAEFKDLSFVSVVELSGRWLLAGTTPKARVAVIDTLDHSNYTILTIPNDEPYVTALYGEGDEFWVGTTKSNAVWHARAGDSAVEVLGVGTSGALRMGRLDDSHLWAAQQGGAATVDLITGQVQSLDLISDMLQPAPQKPMTMHWADGKVFVPGSGVMAMHTPGAQPRTIATMGEVKDLDAVNGSLYGGVYTLALFGEMPTDGDNFTTVARVPKELEQTRPHDVAVDLDHNRVLMGSAPDYGAWNGAFSWMDLTTREVTAFRGLLESQAISALCPVPGGAMLGGNVFNSFGTSPVRATAELSHFSYKTNSITASVAGLPPTKGFDWIGRKGNQVLALTQEGVLICLERKSLRILWQTKVGKRGGRCAFIGPNLYGSDADAVWSVKLQGKRTPRVRTLLTGLKASWWGIPAVTTDGTSLYTLRGLDLIRIELEA